MRTARLTPAELAGLPAADLLGAVLLAPAALPTGTLPKGARLDATRIATLQTAVRGGWLTTPLRLAWPGQGDLHEDEAATRLARAAAGAHLEIAAPRQSRVDLRATCDGILHVQVEALTRLNRVDPLEVFTLYHGSAVRAGQLVASAKVAPHLLPEVTLTRGEAIAREAGPLVWVAPYLPLEVGAIVAEPLAAKMLAKFEGAIRMKLAALGARFHGTTPVADPDPATAEAGARAALDRLALQQKLPVILVGGVSAGDPLAPFFAALHALGGAVLRYGVPAHPGSMMWLAELGETRLLGLPQCGMFSLATAADLILPRLLTGEPLGADGLAEMAHGGLLTRDMRFRFPEYAKGLEAPE